MGGRLRLVPGILVGALVTLSVEACCNYQVVHLAPASSDDCPVGRAPSARVDLRACLSTLDFDTLLSVGDEQRLMVRGPLPGPPCHGDSSQSCRYGPLAKIEPVRGAQARDTTELNQGRIIARIFLRRGETEPYPKLGLEPGDTTYWWIRRTSATTARSSYIRVSGITLASTPEQTIQIEVHAEEPYQQALARFVWDEMDELPQGPCGHGCCKGGGS